MLLNSVKNCQISSQILLHVAQTDRQLQGAKTYSHGQGALLLDPTGAKPQDLHLGWRYRARNVHRAVTNFPYNKQ